MVSFHLEILYKTNFEIFKIYIEYKISIEHLIGEKDFNCSIVIILQVFNVYPGGSIFMKSELKSGLQLSWASESGFV